MKNKLVRSFYDFVNEMNKDDDDIHNYFYKDHLKTSYLRGIHYFKNNHPEYIDKQVLEYFRSKGDDDTIVKCGLDGFYWRDGEHQPFLQIYVFHNIKHLCFVGN
jgi:hypothetical protein